MNVTTIEKIFSAPDYIILFGLVLLYVLTGVCIFWLCNREKSRNSVAKFSGVVPPFIGVPTSLFALTSALLGVAVWQNYQANADAVYEESRAISAFIQLTEAIPSLRNKGLNTKARDYARSAVEVEWPIIVRERKRSPETDQAIGGLLTQTAEVATQPGMPLVIAQVVMQSVQTVNATRNIRLSLLNIRPDPVRWLCVLLLGLMVQVGVAIVHVDKPRPMALSLTVSTLAIIFILGLIALSVQAHTGRVSVSNEPLKNLIAQTTS